MTIILDGTTGITTPAINSSGDLELPGGTANGVLYLNGSKVATSGSALVFDGTNLGVGTSSPATKLHVDSDATNTTVTIESDLDGGSLFTSGISLLREGTAAGSRIQSIRDAGVGGVGLNFLTTADNAAEVSGTLTSRMVIDRSGNVGIGTSSPGQKLEVAGNIFVNTSGNPYVEVKTSGAGNNPYLKLTADTNNWIVQGTFSNTNDELMFQYNSSTLMALDKSGNLGVGTSSPVTLKSATTLQVNGNCKLGNANDRGLLSLGDTASTGANVGVWRGAAGAYGSAGNYLNLGGYDGITFTTGNADIDAQTERARITSGGDLLVGVTSAAAGSSNTIYNGSNSTWALRVQSGSASAPNGILVKYSGSSPNGTGDQFLYCEDSGNTQRMSVRSNGGIANYSANDANLSDERVKTDIAPLGSMWNKFKAIEIVTFKYKDQTHDDDNIGVIAQQVEAVAPEFVDVDGWGETPEDGVPLKSIYTTDMYHAAIKALQEAMTRIEALEAEVAALKGAN